MLRCLICLRLLGAGAEGALSDPFPHYSALLSVVFSLNYSSVEVVLMIGFGVFGYLARKFQYEWRSGPGPGPGADDENNASFPVTRDPMIFVTHPTRQGLHGRPSFYGFLHPLISKRCKKLQERWGKRGIVSDHQRSVRKEREEGHDEIWKWMVVVGGPFAAGGHVGAQIFQGTDQLFEPL